jgi:hypothetical protein
LFLTLTRTSEVLDVRMTAELLTVSPDSENNTLDRAIERGDRHVITTALKSGKVQIKKQK